MQKRVWLLGLGIVLIATAAYAAFTTQHVLGSTVVTLLSSELNSLTSTSYSVAGTADNNTISGTTTGAGYIQCRIEGSFTFGGNPTANTAIGVWLLKSVDGGATYETTPGASVGFGRPYDVVLPVNSAQATTKVSVDTRCPAGFYRAAARNDGTNQTLAASGNTIKAMKITPQLN